MDYQTKLSMNVLEDALQLLEPSKHFRFQQSHLLRGRLARFLILALDSTASFCFACSISNFPLSSTVTRTAVDGRRGGKDRSKEHVYAKPSTSLFRIKK